VGADGFLPTLAAEPVTLPAAFPAAAAVPVPPAEGLLPKVASMISPEALFPALPECWRSAACGEPEGLPRASALGTFGRRVAMTLL
jgi:hypothetical protein